jgi:hypothetical protein
MDLHDAVAISRAVSVRQYADGGGDDAVERAV